MKRRIDRTWWFGILGALVLATIWTVPGWMTAASPGQADQPEPAHPQSAAAPAAEKPKAEKSPADPFALPDSGPEELLNFIEGLRDKEPPQQDFDTVQQFRRRRAEAMANAADKLLAAKPTQPQVAAAVNAKLEALGELSKIGEPTAANRLKTLPAELRKLGFGPQAHETEGVLLLRRFQGLEPSQTKELAGLIGEVAKYLSAGPIDRLGVHLAMTAAHTAEMLDEKLAVDAYRQFGEALRKSKNKAIDSLGQRMEGAVRRLELVGRPMRVEGQTFAGKPFDWSKYRGKLVLVDFWATWCGPCVAEIENIRENYAAYHGRGFDVVGINLDEDREAVKEFLKKKEIPWTILYDQDAKESLADYYGIVGIPAVFLVGPDGKVLSSEVRGPALGEILAKRLGPVKKDKVEAAAKQ